MLFTFLSAGVGAFIVAHLAAYGDVRDRISEELAVMQEARERGGVAEVRSAIAYRTSYPTTFAYRLEDESGQTLAGNPAVPNEVLGWRFFELPTMAAPSIEHDYYVYTEAIPGGLLLSIADDMERSERIRDAILETLLWVGIAAVLIGVLAGYLATRPILKRMTLLSEAVQTVAAGKLDVRIPMRPARRPDDLDQLIESFNGMLERIEALVESVRRVSINVAHDLRTPLTRVRRRLEMMTHGDEAEQTQALAAVQGDIDAILRASDAILELSAIEAGSARAQFTQLNLVRVVEGVFDAYLPDIEQSGRSIDIVVPENVSLMGEPNHLARMLANLIENAMNHTPTGTRISVTVDVAGGRPRLTVRDNGPGIPQNERTRMLKPFERLDQSRTTSGAGLGLSIAKAVARLHNAEMTLSDAGPGLAVTVIFPAAQEATP